MIFVLSVMRVVGGVPLWVMCVFGCVGCCIFVSIVHTSCYFECDVLCYL